MSEYLVKNIQLQSCKYQILVENISVPKRETCQAPAVQYCRYWYVRCFFVREDNSSLEITSQNLVKTLMRKKKRRQKEDMKKTE